MSWINYHGHSNYCDGHGRIEEYIQSAIDLHMPAIGISSHAPVPFDCFWTMKEKDLSLYLKELEDLKVKYKDKIDVYKSLEVDYIPGVAGPSIVKEKELPLDYLIGSIHFVDSFKDGTPWGIDGNFDDFDAGLQQIFYGDIKTAVQQFYFLTREMIKQGGFDIIGHMDKIKMHNVTEVLFNENEDWYQQELDETLDLIAKNNIIVEINTKSFKKNGLLFPGKEYFSILKSKGIGITINSDAHYPADLQSNFSFVANELLNVGFSTVKEFMYGEWIDVSFHSNGLSYK